MCVWRLAAALEWYPRFWHQSWELPLCTCEQHACLTCNSVERRSLIVCFSCSCTDVNPAAAQCTATTASCNSVSLQPVVTDLVRLLLFTCCSFSCAEQCASLTRAPFQVECLLPQLSGEVDVLLFNPPYVVTPSEEVLQLYSVILEWCVGYINHESCLSGWQQRYRGSLGWWSKRTRGDGQIFAYGATAAVE